MYIDLVIWPEPSGFGEYAILAPEGELWASEADLLDEIRESGRPFTELAIDDLSIRGAFYGETWTPIKLIRLFYYGDTGEYFGIGEV